MLLWTPALIPIMFFLLLRFPHGSACGLLNLKNKTFLELERGYCLLLNFVLQKNWNPKFRQTINFLALATNVVARASFRRKTGYAPNEEGQRRGYFILRSAIKSAAVPSSFEYLL